MKYNRNQKKAKITEAYVQSRKNGTHKSFSVKKPELGTSDTSIDISIFNTYRMKKKIS
jgi:hypothetical protein